MACLLLLCLIRRGRCLVGGIRGRWLLGNGRHHGGEDKVGQEKSARDRLQTTHTLCYDLISYLHLGNFITELLSTLDFRPTLNAGTHVAWCCDLHAFESGWERRDLIPHIENSQFLPRERFVSTHHQYIHAGASSNGVLYLWHY